MIVFNALALALREIRRNALRSGLTALGIIIGVAAVIALVTLGKGATARVTNDIAALGNNLLVVAPGGEQRGGAVEAARSFELSDVDAIDRDVRGIAATAPMSSRRMVAVFGNQNWPTNVNGSTASYVQVRDWTVAEGRMFTDGEARAGRALCVLGATVVEELFGNQDPVGRSVRLDRMSCRVIGVFEAKGEASFGQDQDDFVLMPLRTFQRRIGGTQRVALIFVSAADSAETSDVQKHISALMRDRRGIREGQEDDFRVNDLKEIADTVATTTGILTALLGAIAGISLLVGGIGIMNIMLVSVTERTREIGTRLAIGAMERDVLTQFLVEAIVLATSGGTVGIGLGLLCSAAVGRYLELPFVVDPLIIVVAFAFSGFVGVVFGFFPARKAARLNPIDALRHE
ncbi:MAG: ABC transporter permease [Myxococcota bacterium]